jgi:hypothetical protein
VNRLKAVRLKGKKVDRGIGLGLAENTEVGFPPPFSLDPFSLTACWVRCG